ncbi:hypothetical protein, partial [Streptomyces huiliensis]|uniref:hypothetical protein n=1 Tax=Streptomyces huiliensis TaxID=2876027 RepID=UPI001CBF276D
ERRWHRERAVAEHRLDEVFDGDWNAAAGRLLLRWYGLSPHPHRLVILARSGRVYLAAPLRRVATGRNRKARTLTVLDPSEAVLEDPAGPGLGSDKLRLRFHDGSWIVLTALVGESDLHAYLHGVGRPAGG